MSRVAARLLTSLLLVVGMGLASGAWAGDLSSFRHLKAGLGEHRFRFWLDTTDRYKTLWGLEQKIAKHVQKIPRSRAGEPLCKIVGLALDNLMTIKHHAATRFTERRIVDQANGLAEVGLRLFGEPGTSYTFGKQLSAYQKYPAGGYHKAEIEAAETALRGLPNAEPTAVVNALRRALSGHFLREPWRYDVTIASVKRALSKGELKNPEQVIGMVKCALRAYPMDHGVIEDEKGQWGIIAVEGKGKAVQVTRQLSLFGTHHSRLRYADKLNEEQDPKEGVLIMLDQQEHNIRVEELLPKGGKAVARWTDSLYLPFPSMPKTGDVKRVSQMVREVDRDGEPCAPARARALKTPVPRRRPGGPHTGPGPMMEGVLLGPDPG